MCEKATLTENYVIVESAVLLAVIMKLLLAENVQHGWCVTSLAERGLQ
jgi:hypothetical protein